MRLWKNGGSWRPGLPGKFPLKNGNIFYSVGVIAFDRGRTILMMSVYLCVNVWVYVCNCNTEDAKVNTEDTQLELYL